MPVSSRVRKVIAAQSRLPGVAQLDEHANLFEAGLESMEAVNTILGLEEEFGIVIPDAQLSRENTSSIAKLVDLVSAAG
jgi:acyl carrier protein